MPYVIGVDLGGTKTELGIVDETGHMHQHLRLATSVNEGAQAVENQILEGIHILQKQMNVPLSGVGIGLAGQIDPQTGEVIFAPNLKWHHVPIQSNMSQALHLPVYVINDVRAITWGEWLYGAGQGCENLICVFVGTGIGSGVVSGGRLLTGCHNALGEVGHMTIDFNGPVCTCGNRGCLEAYAGGWGIAARAREAIEADGKGTASQLLLELAGQQLSGVTAKTVVQAYLQGDLMAQHLIEAVRRALIVGCTNIVNAFNPCRLILGGGFIDGFPELINQIDQGVQRLALKAITQNLSVMKAVLGKEVGVIGSAVAMFNTLQQQERAHIE